MDTGKVNTYVSQIIEQAGRVVVGQERALEHLTSAMFAGGHVLLEGVPGTAKTLLARLLSVLTDSKFMRVQFTPDLMPSDIVGVNIYNNTGSCFEFRHGPVFSDIFLADEVNRAPAKTQSALLEAMEEQSVSVDGVTYPLSKVFMVVATQNPVEFEGTYPLPEAQLDRFMLKINIDYPELEHENRILANIEAGFDSRDLSTANIEKVVDLATLAEIRDYVRKLPTDQKVLDYIVKIVRETRVMPQIALGAGPRSGGMLLLAAKAHSVVSGYEFVTPDSVKEMALPVLRHRVILKPEYEIEGRSADDCLNVLLGRIEVPR